MSLKAQYFFIFTIWTCYEKRNIYIFYIQFSMTSQEKHQMHKTPTSLEIFKVPITYRQILIEIADLPIFFS